ncbi:unnamed protein product [Timema podura]|uniref:Uncharacterized protein n=1 Tax=Timema podura TaxID=61482 RepID=A0ABN7PA81_TIMPD|nr:unnamed protein product [Timema podura]
MEWASFAYESGPFHSISAPHLRRTKPDYETGPLKSNPESAIGRILDHHCAVITTQISKSLILLMLDHSDKITVKGYEENCSD